MYHKRVEKKLERVGELIYHHPKKIILFTFLLMFLPLSQIHLLQMDTSNEGFLHKSSPILKDYYEFKDQFGRDERAIISITSDKIFTKAFLTKLKTMQVLSMFVIRMERVIVL